MIFTVAGTTTLDREWVKIISCASILTLFVFPTMLSETHAIFFFDL
jgi:hypothetical protein